MTAVLDIRDLHVAFDAPDGEIQAVRGVSLSVGEGETVAIVGESGSGKSQTVLAAMGLLAANGRATGEALYRGENLIDMPKRALDRIRGRRIAMIFQEPMTSLDPLLRIGDQIAEPLIAHGRLSPAAARRRAVELLEQVRVEDPERRAQSYPHELSGGQRQRAMIAMALGGDPDLLIADEPTTALDVTIQAEILALLAELKRRHGMSVLFITHDLGVVRAIADRVHVMRDGRIVEAGATGRIFADPRDAYTRMLLDAEPEGVKPPPPADAPALLEGEALSVTFDLGRGLFAAPRPLRAVDSVSLVLRRGQTIGVVGESGSGKSTLGRALLRLLPSQGRVQFDGQDLSELSPAALRPLRKRLQLVFQDPYGSLSPRLTVGEIVAEGLRVHAPELSGAERRARAGEALAEVGLEPGHLERFPHEFSGGQRQRIAIARALILRPSVMVLDEPTSALDRSVQKQVVGLLRRLQARYGLSYLFISHDLAVVRALCDRVLVMRRGEIVEAAATDRLFAAPEHPYTRRLLAAAFDLDGLLRRAAGG